MSGLTLCFTTEMLKKRGSISQQLDHSEQPEMVTLPEIGNPDFSSNSQGVAKVNCSTREGCLDVMLLILELDLTIAGCQRGWQVNMGGSQFDQ